MTLSWTHASGGVIMGMIGADSPTGAAADDRVAWRDEIGRASTSMSDIYESLVRAGLLFAVIFVLTAVVLAIARKLRDGANNAALDANEIMTNFRRVYERGGLSDEEFRTIKAKLADELKSAANDNRNAG